MNNSALLHILDNPISWIHTDWIGPKGKELSGVSKGILNRMLSRFYSLEIGEPTTPFEHSIIGVWNNLDNIASLMASQRHRADLFQRRDIKIPAEFRKFMSLEIITSQKNLALKEVCDLNTLAGVELKALSKVVPEYLAKRIMLKISKTAINSPVEVPFNKTLFQMAVQYAKNNA